MHRDNFDEIARRAHHRRHVVDLDVVGLRQIAFALLRGMPTSSICIMLQYSAHRTCCS
jgi:hypothetical protein